MEVRLHVVHGKANVKEIVLGRETLVGRGAECNLKIASSQVSRRHCRIEVSGRRVLVVDLGSANGTLLNGHPIPRDTPAPIQPDDEIEIGPLRFAVKYQALEAIAPTGDADETSRNPDTVRTARKPVRPGSNLDAETVDFVPDEQRKRELRDAASRALRPDLAMGGTVVAPGETVMDLNLSPKPNTIPPETETFSSPAVNEEPQDETLLLDEDEPLDQSPTITDTIPPLNFDFDTPPAVPAITPTAPASSEPKKKGGLLGLFRRDPKPEPKPAPAAAKASPVSGSADETIDFIPPEPSPAAPSPVAPPVEDDDEDEALKAFLSDLK